MKEKAPAIPEIGEIKKRKLFDNNVAYKDWVIKNTLLLYPVDHPLTTYTKDVFAQGLPSEKTERFSLNVYHGGPNAFCLPNGSIYLSDGWFTIAGSEEGVTFALDHEREHIQNDHAWKQTDGNVASPSPKGIINDARSHLGQARLHEWESDLRAFANAEERGRNPVGGIQALENMRQYEKDGGGMVHGSGLSRILNLRTMTHLHDIATIQEPLHDIPTDVLSNVPNSLNNESFYEKFVSNVWERDTKKIERSLREMTPARAIICLPDILSLYSSQRATLGESAQRWADNQHYLITAMGQHVWQDIDTKLPEATNKKKTLAFHSAVSLSAGYDTAQQNMRDVFTYPKVTKLLDTQQPWNKRLVGLAEQLYTVDDIQTLLSVLTPETFATLDYKLTVPPISFAQNIARHVLEREIYADTDGELDKPAYLDFVRNLTKSLTKLYDEHGLIEVNEKRLLSEILSVNSSFIETEKTIQTPASQLSNLCEHVARNIARVSPREVRETELGNITNIAIKSDTVTQILDHSGKHFDRIINEFPIESEEELLSALVEFRQIAMNRSGWEIYIDAKTQTQIVPAIANRLYARLDDGDDSPAKQLLTRTKIATLLSADLSDADAELGNKNREFRKLLEAGQINESDLHDFYQFITKGFEDFSTSDLQLPNLDEYGDWTDNFKHATYRTLLNNVTSGTSKNDFFAQFKRLTTKFNLDHRVKIIHDLDDFDEDRDAEARDLIPLKSALLEKVFATYDFSLEAPEDLAALYDLSCYFDTTSYSVRLQNIVLPRLVDAMSFDEGIAFFEREILAKRMLSLNAFESFVEKKAKTHDQIKKTKDLAVYLLSSDIASSAVGSAVFGEEVGRMLFNPNTKADLLFAGLANKNSDRELKDYLYDIWNGNSGYQLDLFNFNILVQQLYSMDAQSKYLIVRDILTGDKGVLTNKDPRYREQLVDYFFDNYVRAESSDEEQMFGVAKHVMQEFVKSAPYDLLYFAIAPLIQKRFLVPPSESVPWEEIVENKPLVMASRYDVKEVPVGKKQTVNLIPTKKGVQQIVNELTGSKQFKNYREDEKLRLRYEEAVVSLIASEEENEEQILLSVPQFISEIGRSLGAPGIRTLQFLRLYLSLSPQLAAEFDSVYDDVSGQSKIAADRTMLREWPGAEQEIVGLGERLGGGSLMTVFKSEHVSDAERASKVLNPNALFHTQTSYDVLSDLFQKLSVREPRFAHVRPILDDIRDWINADVNFTGFIEQDAAFKAKHDGFSTGGRYQIKIPQSFPPENKHFIQEEFIEGTNLTKMHANEADIPGVKVMTTEGLNLEKSLTEQGHDVREIVSLLVNNFFTQVADGQVHSNIHPGNVRITPDNKVALLDRNYYLHLNNADKEFLVNIIGSFDDIGQTVDHALNYLSSQGASIENAKREQIMQESTHIATVSDPTQKMLDMSVLLRTNGLRFPLPMTLLTQNIFYLDWMSKQVGYRGLMDVVTQ